MHVTRGWRRKFHARMGTYPILGLFNLLVDAFLLFWHSNPLLGMKPKLVGGRLHKGEYVVPMVQSTLRMKPISVGKRLHKGEYVVSYGLFVVNS